MTTQRRRRRKTEEGTVAFNLCGFCAGAARSESVEHAHARCYSTDGKNFRCACSDNEHRLTPDIATYMSAYNQMPVEMIYEKHGRKRRVLSEEQRVQKSATLAKARAAKAAKRVAGAKDTVAL